MVRSQMMSIGEGMVRSQMMPIGEGMVRSQMMPIGEGMVRSQMMPIGEGMVRSQMMPIGEGMYGKVYKGTWQGQEVAVKRMMLPTNMSGAEKNQRMAVMEAAISSSLHHPNIVKTHTYSLKPVFDKLASAPATSQTLGQPLKASRLESTSHASSDISAGKCNASNTLIEPLSMPASPAFGDNYPDATNVVSRFQRQVPKLVGKCDQSSDEVSSIVVQAGASSKDDFAPRGDRKWNKPNASASPSGGFSFQSLSGTDCTLLPRVLGFEVQIVLEYCDCGSLRDVLDAGRAFVTASYEINYSAMLDIALDIAKGMEHLHSTGLIHSDLKARNVLLRRNPIVDCGVVAKISDFGLSFQMESSETHVSDLYQGTTTHLAPEVILEGRQSRMSDVYAYGITLWELYTALRPFSMIPAALVGHQVTQEGVRPEFPQDAPEGYVMLVQQCWNQQATERPSFSEVVNILGKMRRDLGGQSSPLAVGPSSLQSPPHECDSSPPQQHQQLSRAPEASMSSLNHGVLMEGGGMGEGVSSNILLPGLYVLGNDSGFSIGTMQL
ncbi:hypothetical protein CEUSTIGMA_g6997.t1 [Chlamydomonas eustigma]|uniref:Protein kinase domain-containing protein n=1 Tax=Chlamydomonas eustigma TaxID=1157962 RepID=A0A250X914_9CHLO|nr:hypothetical protein CEUSTIGMA_g6997.t1 [Chlamydomonas eustigma]|eukprot:GAX79556.1 hypothetical protein CEUSTIGMA_g6997.t1 [Chlamydomonas eustigma]